MLQQLVEVDPLACPTCHGALRLVAFMTQASVIDQLLAHLRTRAARATHAGPQSPPSTRAPTSRGPSRTPRPSAEAPTTPCVPPPASRSPAGTVGVRGRPTAASPWAPPALATPADRRWCGTHGPRTRGRARSRLSRGAGEVGDRAGRSTNGQPTPIEMPIPCRDSPGDDCVTRKGSTVCRSFPDFLIVPPLTSRAMIGDFE